MRNGTHVLNNVTTSGDGTLEVSTENVGADALVTINGGTLNAAFLLSGSSVNGTDQVFQGPATWTGGTLTGTDTQSTTFAGTLTISGALTKSLSGGRDVNAGNTTWSGNTANGNNAVAMANTSVFSSTGTFIDANAFDSAMTGGTFSNSGTFNKAMAHHHQHELGIQQHGHGQCECRDHADEWRRHRLGRVQHRRWREARVQETVPTR
jgi:hypothetical protein